MPSPSAQLISVISLKFQFWVEGAPCLSPSAPLGCHPESPALFFVGRRISVLTGLGRRLGVRGCPMSRVLGEKWDTRESVRVGHGFSHADQNDALILPSGRQPARKRSVQQQTHFGTGLGSICWTISIPTDLSPISC